MHSVAKIRDDGQRGFASRLMAVRVRSGLNQAQFCEMLGFPKRTYLNWERMEAPPPAVLIQRLGSILLVDANWLLFGPGEEPQYRDEEGRRAQVAAAIRSVAEAAEICLPAQAIEALAETVVARPINFQAAMLWKVRTTLMLGAGKTP